MKKETFVMAIEAIEKQYRHDVEVSKKLEEIFPDCYSANMLYDNHHLVNALIQVLKEEMNDTEISKDCMSWIEWYCFELDFGKKSKGLTACRADGSIIKMENACDLYDFLIE